MERRDDTIAYAPGWPGSSPRWTSSAKVGIGTALNGQSRIWFTLSHGILNEVYYPRVDQACIRDLGLIVTDGQDFFSEEKRHTQHEVTRLAVGVPGYNVVNTCEQGRYRIEKEIVADPQRPALMQSQRFVPLNGVATDYRLYSLLAPHLANHGANNTAWVGEYDGLQMLFAARDGCALALACSTGWVARSVGFVGVSDGWQDLHAHRRLTRLYERAENGNVALTGEVNMQAGSELVLALGFGENANLAAKCVVASLSEGFASVRNRYAEEWKAWQSSLTRLSPRRSATDNLDAISTAVIRTCESKEHTGGIVASLSIPWGFEKGDGDLGGYHLVWPRDLVETAGALVAVGAADDARRVLSYLQSTQNEDGHWSQNMWIDGTPYWDGIQLDETAFPILLVDLMQREQLLRPEEVKQLWPMIRRAAVFLVINGPVTLQDRWEEDPGYSPFTLAVTIAALLIAADFADDSSEPTVATFLRESADAWNESVERWTYVTETELAHRAGVEGYYVRIAPPEVADAASPTAGFVPIKNRPPGQDLAPASYIISPDALALVRFGLRKPDDPRIVNTVKAIDAFLKVDVPGGPDWHRYNDDGYGEHEDGSPFDGTGIGRAWPLLAGERAHYELAAGRLQQASTLLHTMEAFANEGGFISEQVWDSADIPKRELFLGRPSGSAMPLVWAHAEYLKLRRSLEDGRVFDLPPQTKNRYAEKNTGSPFCIWRFSHKCRSIPVGKVLRLETLAPAVVRWSTDEWKTANNTSTRNTDTGIHVTDLPTSELTRDDVVLFTFYWTGADRWEDVNFRITVGG